MLRDYTEGGLLAVRQLALQAGSQAIASLEKQLTYLDEYAEGRANCTIYKDFFAPNSFGLVMRDAKTQEVWWVGGLIYSGPGLGGEGEIQSDGQGPSFSVDLCPAPRGEHSWKVHT